MDPIAKKEPQNPGYVHRTQEERSKSQNKKPYSQRIKSSHPAFSSKKENLNQEGISQELRELNKLKQLSKDVNQSSASEIIEVSSVKIKKANQNSQSYLNDFNHNMQVNNSLNGKKINEDKNSIQTIQEQKNEETQKLFGNQKKNNFLKNNQILDQRLQNVNINNQQNNPNVSKVTKQIAIKIRQRSNSPTILKTQGQQQSHQNRIISANLQSKAIAAANMQNFNEYKINMQSNKKREFEDVTINSNEESINSIQQKEKFKQLQGAVKPISQLQQQLNKKKFDDSILSSNNSSDVENNGDKIQDKRVKSISLTPGIALHNQFNLKESQNTFDPLEATNNSNLTQKRKSLDNENKLPRINKVIAKTKETTLYNQLRESNQKNALELPSIIDNIKQNVNSCENLFKNRFKDKQGGFQGQFQQASVNQMSNIKETEINYDFETENQNIHEQFDKVIMKQIKIKNDQGLLKKNKRQVESAKKRDSTVIIQNKNKIKDDSSISKESPNQIFKYIRQSQHGEQRESVNRRDSSISHKQNGASIQQFIQARNRIKSENNVMQNNSNSNYQDKSFKDDSEGESFSTADRKKLKKLNQIQSYLKNKIESNQKQNLNGQNQGQSSNSNQINNSLISNNNNNNNNNNQNNPQKSQPHNKIQMQIQQQQLLQISKNQQQAMSNQKQQNNLVLESYNDQKQGASPKQQDMQELLNQQNQKMLQQKGVIEVLDQALCKRKEDKISKSISQQIEKEIDKLNVLTSKSQNARDQQLKIQEELIKYNLKIKLNKMKVVDIVQENEQEENF
ncbi:hypothetical protein TTHERM_00353360 (macronuclear) [Tetrahymena thermophila SB210]|uniref:Uncharacterized protein n=1 Tax=Tetrahymena thermophila (strain SB210) TaxID=312017 RepID=I7M9U8_TETTS|nr:hypothetical protein TTHERM_00353360 [Tetrahymena thermophila SB210]EAS02850.1 hypothetical protein TTHERM_00353360 [Tetrahymena thermophila SB210]|eukprot:XP_001023095.1 hypothetical protein TTHERM_00353360 [Tetrahymena thermophila SB210]